MKKFLPFVLLSVTINIFAQQGDGGIPRGFKFDQNTKSIDSYLLPQPDVKVLLEEDAINDKSGNTFWRFAIHHTTNYTIYNSGSWEQLPDGGKIWRLNVSSKGALTLNLIFKDVVIPQGAELFIYNPEKTFVLGRFTQKHITEGQLGSEIIPGNSAIVELFLPKNIENAELTLYKVGHGYRTAAEYITKGLNTSGACNMNVNCPDGLMWEDQKRSAIMIASSNSVASGFCSGALINNTENDGKPYILTANHCGSSGFASWFFRFNWESATCSNPGTSPAYQSLSGAVSRANRQASDFRLLEITGGLESGTIPAAINAYFAGWNNSNVSPTTSVSIHHPDGDIKKISFDDDSATVAMYGSGGEANNTWRVVWDRNTTTEGGSSGSPLFNQNGHIIGQLWGGQASCSNQAGPDYYGRLFNSWQPSGSSNNQQLKYWLDPNNTGATYIDGYDPHAIAYNLDARILSINSPGTGITCETSFTPSVTIRNNGTATLTTLTISYHIDNGTPVSHNWTGSLSSGATELVILPTFNATAGTRIFTAYLSAPNGGSDENTANDTLVRSYEILAPVGNSLPFSESFESTTFPPSGWSIENSGGNAATWKRVTNAAAQGNASAVKDNLNSNDAGATNNLITPFLDFSGLQDIALTFKVAYRTYGIIYIDSLNVFVSKDCGNTWDRVYNKGGNTLSTVAGNQTSAFIPTSSQWRTETIDLSSYAGENHVQIRFQNKSGYGQLLYIDNINIKDGTDTNNTSITEVETITANLFPNPGTDVIYIRTNDYELKKVNITDLSGKIISENIYVENTIPIDISALANGIYLINIQSKNQNITNKFVKQ